jgi:flagellar biosynthesis protein FlhF
MRMKQITAANIQDALSLARRELGEDAVLLDTKKSGTGKGIIVTFAVEEEDDILPAVPFNHPPADILPFPTEMPPMAMSTGAEPEHPALTLITEAIRYHGMPLMFAERLLARVYKTRLHPDSVIDAAEAALAEALAAVLVFKPIVTASPPPTRAIMLVGPHGAGKTSTIAKLATELTLRKQPLVLISCDLERLGGADSLQQLADILKCPFHLGDSRAELKSLLTKYQGKSWVLIDSSGTNIYEFAQLKALGELAGLQGIEPILTCPAGMDASEAQEMAGVFNFLNIERMITTRMDAVRRLGSVFSALSTGGFALSNITSSAILTDACVPLSAAALARFMLRHVRERSSH